MPRGVPGTRTGFALGHPGAAAKAVRAGMLPGSSLVLNGQVKQSMRYLATGASVATCNVDRSQYGTNMGVTNGVLFEVNTVRMNHSHPRTLACRVQANNTDTGTLWRHRTVGDLEQLRFSAANTIVVVVNNATALTYTVAGLTAARKNLVIAWVSQANDDTTGAADAVLSWLMVWNLDDGTFDKVPFTHAAKNLGSQNCFWGANDTTPANAFTGTITGVWYESRTASASEIAHDWVSTLPLVTTETDVDDQGLPVSSSVGFAAANAFHGPAAAWACDATRRLRYRLFSALWNDCMRVTPTWNNSIHGATDAWVRAAPDSNTWRMHLTHKRSYPVPLGATHLWVRAHVQIWNTIGTGPVIAGFRLYSMNKNPSDAAGPALVPYFVEQVVSRDEGSGAEGSYVLKARVPISRDADGWTTLVLAIAVDPNNESNLDSRTAFRVKAVHCVPLVVDQIGGLGFGGGLGD